MNHNPLLLLGLCANRAKSCWVGSTRGQQGKSSQRQSSQDWFHWTWYPTQQLATAENTPSATWPPEKQTALFRWESQTPSLDFPASSSQASAFSGLEGAMNDRHYLSRSCSSPPVHGGRNCNNCFNSRLLCLFYLGETPPWL